MGKEEKVEARKIAAWLEDGPGAVLVPPAREKQS